MSRDQTYFEYIEYNIAYDIDLNAKNMKSGKKM